MSSANEQINEKYKGKKLPCPSCGCPKNYDIMPGGTYHCNQCGDIHEIGIPDDYFIEVNS